MKREGDPAPPSDAELEKALGGAYEAFTAFLDRNTDLWPEWKYYGRQNGSLVGRSQRQ